MKKIMLSVVGAALVFAATPQLGRARTPPASLNQQTDPETKTFTGTVVKNGDNFMLSDSANKLAYVLDDAKKASEFEGKKVKVTGTVNAANNMIHVETIQQIA